MMKMFMKIMKTLKIVMESVHPMSTDMDMLTLNIRPEF